MSNLSTLPKGDSAWLLRKAIERIIQQVSVLETNIGASTSGNSANTQVIFNDNGTLRGDAGLVYNKTTDTLTAGSATITGDLTVRTNKLLVTATGVGVGAVSVNPFDVTSTSGTLSVFKRTGSNGAFIGIQDGSGGLAYLGYTNGVFSIQTSGSGYSDKYTITTDGTATWYVAGTTAMTLNSTGLTVSTGTTNPLDLTNAAVTTERQIKIENSTVTAYLGVEPAAGGRFIGSAAGNAYFGTNVAYGLEFATNNNVRMTLNTTGNLAFKDGLGIDFSAKTPDGSGTVGSEVLNDYEEGTWTIGLTFGGGNTGLTTSASTGRYTKVGRQVTVCGRFEILNKGSSTGAAVITGLPFSITNATEALQAASFRFNGVSYTGSFQGYGTAGSTTIPLEQISEAGSLTDLTNSNFVNGTSIQISFTYTV
jgi:hypothetical protein